MTSRPHARGAFTLIELMAVVALIAILLALLVPALSAAREAMDSNTCRSNMRQIVLAMVAYNMDYGKLPGNSGDDASVRWLTVSGGPALKDQKIGGVLARKCLEMNAKVLTCPTLKNLNKVGGDVVVCHYAIPTILSGAPMGKVLSGSYTAADGTEKTLPGVPMVVEPRCYKDSGGTIINDLGTYDTASGTWTVLPNGGFEGARSLDAHRHNKCVHIACHNQTVVVLRDMTDDLPAAKVKIQFDTGKAARTLTGPFIFGDWTN